MTGYRFSDWGSRLSTKGTRNNDFWGGLFLGACIGLIWTPCAGPILATVIVQIILQKSDIQSGIILFTFALGVGAPMLLIATGGQKMIQSLGFFRQHSLAVRRTLGVIILLTVVFGIQQGLILPSVNPEGASSVSAKLVDALPAPYQSPEIKGIDAWINSGPLTIKSLKGKVVLTLASG